MIKNINILEQLNIVGICISFTILLLVSGCSNYDPVPVDRCDEVVKHAKKVLGSMAQDRATMMADCKAASDSDRGCVLAATKKGQLAQCF